jgi:BirA family biotin operon repressor/biotin-[acetyl-CoA-carboxylase] ligase
MRAEASRMQDDALDVAVLQQLLATPTFGRTLHILPQTASTNDEVKRLAAHGAPEGTVVIAAQQTHGRGRHGRSFVSPLGGIYLSLLLRPRLQAQCLPQLTLLVAVAAAEAITEVSALPVRLKWPNDIEIHGKKVAGILVEAVIHAGLPAAVIVGIGINVNTTLEQFPQELQARVTSLSLAAGRPFARSQLIATLLTHLERLYCTFQEVGTAPIRQRWLHYGAIAGRALRFVQDGRSHLAAGVGLDEDGALVVRLVDGTPQRIIAGDVDFL